jgi:hypothetical protein
MRSARRLPLLLVVLVALVATGVATSLKTATNPSQLPSGLAVSLNAESTALYCTGISSHTGRPGRVTFYNTSSASRRLSVSVVSDKGHTFSRSIELPGHASQSIEPSAVDQGDNFAVAAQINGGGVVGEEIAGTLRTEVPCAAAGITQWYATGFNTLVGSSAYLSVYNPTATPAVLNASIYSASGFSAPQSFQGLSVPAHAQSEIDLGTEVVNTENVGVGVTVLRGSIVVVGVQDANGVVSLDPGVTGVSNETYFPLVTTAQGATAQVRVANPSNQRAQVTVKVALGSYHVAPQVLSLAPFSAGLINITPNPAIPAAGYANLTLHSSVPVISALATGTRTWITLSSPITPGNAFLVNDFTDLGFGAATVTNTSSHLIKVNVSSYLSSSLTVVHDDGAIKLAGGQTQSLFLTIPSFSSTPSATYLVSSSKPSLVVALTLPTRPPGVYVVAPLDGR